MLLNIAEDFVEELTSTACELARHRGSDSLEAKDVAFCLSEFRNAAFWSRLFRHAANLTDPYSPVCFLVCILCACAVISEKYWNTTVPGSADTK